MKNYFLYYMSSINLCT